MKIPVFVREQLIGHLDISERTARDIADHAYRSNAGRVVLRPTIRMGEIPELLEFSSHLEETSGTADKITITSFPRPVA
jgi:hypothetical protein